MTAPRIDVAPRSGIRHRPRSLLAAALACAVLGACASAPPPVPDFPPLDYSGQPPIRVTVAAVDLLDGYISRGDEPNVDTRFPLPPAEGAKQWAAQRFQAAGRSGSMSISVIDGSVIEEKLKRRGGLEGALTTEQSERYTANLKVEVIIARPDGSTAGSATATAQITRTTPENLTYNQRREIWYDMTRQLVADIDAEITKRMNNELAGFLAR